MKKEQIQDECLWYNGEMSCYELLDFNPNGLSKKEIITKAKECLKRKYAFTEKRAWTLKKRKI